MNMDLNATSPFIDRSTWIIEHVHSFARYDNFPVSRGHVLVVPKRIVRSIFDLADDEYADVMLLVREVKGMLDMIHDPDGYNVGFNDGPVAGQTIMHAHIHVIPRYKGDHDDPRGGVRAVIPDRKIY